MTHMTHTKMQVRTLCYIIKLIPFWKLTFKKQPIIAKAEVKIGVNLANK